MRRFFGHGVLALTIVGLLFGVSAWAAGSQFGIDETRSATGGLLPDSISGAKTAPEVIGSVISIALSLLGIVFFILALYAGFTWMTARGNSEKVDKAKDVLESAVIGVLVVLASYAIAQFVFSNLGSAASGSGAPSGATTNQSAATATCSKPYKTTYDCYAALCDPGSIPHCAGTICSGLPLDQCPSQSNPDCTTVPYAQATKNYCDSSQVDPTSSSNQTWAQECTSDVAQCETQNQATCQAQSCQ